MNAFEIRAVHTVIACVCIGSFLSPGMAIAASTLEERTAARCNMALGVTASLLEKTGDFARSHQLVRAADYYGDEAARLIIDRSEKAGLAEADTAAYDEVTAEFVSLSREDLAALVVSCINNSPYASR